MISSCSKISCKVTPCLSSKVSRCDTVKELYFQNIVIVSLQISKSITRDITDSITGFSFAYHRFRVVNIGSRYVNYKILIKCNKNSKKLTDHSTEIKLKKHHKTFYFLSLNPYHYILELDGPLGHAGVHQLVVAQVIDEPVQVGHKTWHITVWFKTSCQNLSLIII